MPKPAIVLLHGFRGAPLGLEAIADDLRAAGYDVHLPPVPPFAGAPLLKEYTPAAYANYLADYLDTHHLKEPILIGHSMGTLIAAAVISERPELFHPHLFLLSPISHRPSRFFALLAPFSAYLPGFLIDFLTTVYLYAGRGTFRQTLRITNACTYLTTCPRHAIFTAAHLSSHYGVADFKFVPTIKFHIIAGRHDRLIPQKSTQKLANQLHITPTFIEGTGHLHNYEKPHETAELLLQSFKNLKNS